jgi:hypothetical protein
LSEESREHPGNTMVDDRDGQSRNMSRRNTGTRRCSGRTSALYYGLH